MKKFIFILSIITLISTAMAQDQSREEMIGQALDDYGKVAGAWHLNEKCKFYKDEDHKNFEQNVALITRALAVDLGNPRILLMIQGSSKKVADDEKYAACDDLAKGIVDWGVNHAGIWSGEIRKIQAAQKQQQSGN